MATGLMPGPPADPSAPAAPVPGQGGNPQDRPASEEEKGLYREVLANCMNAIYEPETAEALAQTMRRSAEVAERGDDGIEGPVVESLAQVISGAVSRVFMDGLLNDLPLTREMGAAATATLATDMGTRLAQSAGVPPLSKEQIQAVYLRSMELMAAQRDEYVQAQQGAAPAGQAPPPAGNGTVA